MWKKSGKRPATVTVAGASLVRIRWQKLASRKPFAGAHPPVRVASLITPGIGFIDPDQCVAGKSGAIKQLPTSAPIGGLDREA